MVIVVLLRWQALFGMCGAWLVCFLLTSVDALPTLPHKYGYKARTDINLDAVTNAQWFFVPYPGGWRLIVLVTHTKYLQLGFHIQEVGTIKTLFENK